MAVQCLFPGEENQVSLLWTPVKLPLFQGIKLFLFIFPVDIFSSPATFQNEELTRLSVKEFLGNQQTLKEVTKLNLIRNSGSIFCPDLEQQDGTYQGYSLVIKSH